MDFTLIFSIPLIGCILFVVISLITISFTCHLVLKVLKQKFYSNSKKQYTVNALLVPAGTIFFEPPEVRVLFKRGYNSRAGTITVSDSKNSEFSPNIS